MAKSNATSGGATLLDEAREGFYRPRPGESGETRPSRPVRAAEPEDDGEPFLRARRRVPVRRGLFPVWAKTRWGKLLFAGILLVTLGAVAGVVLAIRNFFEHDARFRIESASSIQILGNSHLTRGDLLSVFGQDIGHNLFRVQLARRRTELEHIPWVETATVMRLLPNQIRVSVTERKPIAFVEVKGRIELADAEGVMLDMSPRQMAEKHYAFPVVSGISSADSPSERSARMHLFQRFVGDLDSTGENISAQLSEVDLSDIEDVRATVPASGSDLLLHFGQENFLERWRNYQVHIAQWRQQYPQLASVDLRYEREVVLKMAGDAQPAEKAAAPPQRTAAHRAESPKQSPKRIPPARTHAAQAAHHARRRTY